MSLLAPPLWIDMPSNCHRLVFFTLTVSFGYEIIVKWLFAMIDLSFFLHHLVLFMHNYDFGESGMNFRFEWRQSNWWKCIESHLRCRIRQAHAKQKSSFSWTDPINGRRIAQIQSNLLPHSAAQQDGRCLVPMSWLSERSLCVPFSRLNLIGSPKVE